MTSALVAGGEVVLRLVSDDRVAAAWDQPSALAEMSTGALAWHLGAQVTTAHTVMVNGAAAQGKPVVSVLDHYSRAPWTQGDLQADANVQIRGDAETDAARGHAELVKAVGDALEAIRGVFHVPTIASVPWWPYAMTFDDFALTRLMEMVVHGDDLVCSLGAEPVDFPAEVFDPVLALLAAAAARRHGQAPLVRALTRAERAPGSVSAF